MSIIFSDENLYHIVLKIQKLNDRVNDLEKTMLLLKPLGIQDFGADDLYTLNIKTIQRIKDKCKQRNKILADKNLINENLVESTETTSCRISAS